MSGVYLLSTQTLAITLGTPWITHYAQVGLFQPPFPALSPDPPDSVMVNGKATPFFLVPGTGGGSEKKTV